MVPLSYDDHGDLGTDLQGRAGSCACKTSIEKADTLLDTSKDELLSAGSSRRQSE